MTFAVQKALLEVCQVYPAFKSYHLEVTGSLTSSEDPPQPVKGSFVSPPQQSSLIQWQLRPATCSNSVTVQAAAGARHLISSFLASTPCMIRSD